MLCYFYREFFFVAFRDYLFSHIQMNTCIFSPRSHIFDLRFIFVSYR